MYLRTPRRYTRGQRRSPISLRWLWLWLLTPAVVVGGVYLYNNQAIFAPQVQQAISSVMDGAQSGLATAMAPTALPTQDPTERLTRADANWRDGRIESAITDYEGVLDAAPNDVQAHYRLTLGLLMEGQLADGMEAAERTVTANPFSADAWAIRSMALDWNGRFGEAVASGLRALELEPNNARAMAFIAMAYKDMGENTLARETVERALETDPDSYEAYRTRGWLLWEVDYDFEGAKADFQAAYDLAPNLPEQVIDMALITVAVDQDYETAIAMLRDLVELNPQNARVLFQLGNFYYSGLGNFSEAADYLSRCVEISPESITCNGLLGRVQISLEQYAPAIESLQQAIDLGSTSPRHFLWMGRAQIAQGNCPAAVPFLRESYDRAGATGDSEAVTAAADYLAQCQSPIAGLAPEETAEATVEPEVSQ